MTIRNPAEWGFDQIRLSASAIAHSADADTYDERVPMVRRIEVADLGEILSRGLRDFAAARSDVLFIGLIYPIVGLILGRMALGNDMLHLIFPLVAGFVLLGPFLAAGLYEMSRKLEVGQEIAWSDAFNVFTSNRFGSMLKLGIVLAGLFAAWMICAVVIFYLTLGPKAPLSLTGFLNDVFTSPAGWAMIAIGMTVGLVFALAAWAISLISFPMLLDRHVRVSMAVQTSLRVIKRNPIPMLVWGFIVAGSLAIAAVPLLLGFIVVVPVLGHATWHLYRATVD
jgi:uncharacterized membrane protein